MRTLITVSLAALLLTSPGLAQAQQDPDRPQVEGRNAFLKRSFTRVAQTASRHVLKLESLKGKHLGYAVAIEGGFALTAKDVLPRKGASVRAVSAQGQSLTATISGGSEENGIALLKLSGGNVPGISLGSDTALPIGTFVASVGTTSTPLNVGVVSAKKRRVERTQAQKNFLMGLFSDGNDGPQRDFPSVLHYDGPLESEQFGAPLVDKQGQLVGINVSAPYRGSSHAVGIDHIRTFLGALKDAPKRPYLGASVLEASFAMPGKGEVFALEVTGLASDGPSERAGLKQGDLIIEAAGRPVKSLDAFGQLIGARRPGDALNLKVVRGAVERSVVIRLGAR